MGKDAHQHANKQENKWSLLLPFVSFAISARFIRRTHIPLLPHCCSVTTNAQGVRGRRWKLDQEKNMWPLCTIRTNVWTSWWWWWWWGRCCCCCWWRLLLSVTQHMLNRLFLRPRIRSKKKEKEPSVILLHPPSAQQTVAAAISAHSGFLSAVFCWSVYFPSTPPHLPTSSTLTVVKVLRKQRGGPSPWKMQHRHAELWNHGLFSREAGRPFR